MHPAHMRQTHLGPTSSDMHAIGIQGVLDHVKVPWPSQQGARLAMLLQTWQETWHVHMQMGMLCNCLPCTYMRCCSIRLKCTADRHQGFL